MLENNENLVIFTDDEGNDLEFEHLDTVSVDKKIYIVCVPMAEEAEEIEEVIIFEAIKDENEEDMFLQVEDEDVLENVFVEFKERNSDLFDFED